MLPSQIAADPTAAARAQRCAGAIWPTANSYFLLLSTVLLYDYGSKDILLVWLVGGSHDKGTCQFAPNANVPEITGNPAYSFSGTLDYEEPTKARAPRADQLTYRNRRELSGRYVIDERLAHRGRAREFAKLVETYGAGK